MNYTGDYKRRKKNNINVFLGILRLRNQISDHKKSVVIKTMISYNLLYCT